VQLQEQPAEACQLVYELCLEESVSSGMKSTKPLSVLAPEFVSTTLLHQPGHMIEMPQTAPRSSGEARCKLPAIPTLVTVLPAVQSCSATTVFPVLHSIPITSVSTVLPPVSTVLEFGYRCLVAKVKCTVEVGASWLGINGDLAYLL